MRLLTFFALMTATAAFASEIPTESAHVFLHQRAVAWATPDRDAGAAGAGTVLTHLTVVLRRAPERQRAFEDFLRRQQDPASPDFHRWLTPEEVGARFGAPPDAIAAVSAWLGARGLQVDSVSSSRTRIAFSGTAAKVGAAFSTQLRKFAVNGEERIAPSASPQVPAALGGLIAAVHGLETVHERPNLGPEATVRWPAERLKDTSCKSGTCSHYIWPADFTAIYDLNPAYATGINGAGQTIAIIGRANVYLADIENFQSRAVQPVKDPVTIIPPNGVDPGPPASAPVSDPSAIADQSEATLDVTRAASVAPGATIDLIASADSSTASGLSVAAAYAVDTTPVPAHIMSISFGACEQQAGEASVVYWDDLFSQATAEGISVFVSSGDAGAAGCDVQFKTPPANQVASPNYLCSSSFATCVGGTEFADASNASGYWRSQDTLGYGSALGYIPEGAWNEPFDGSNEVQAAGTGGGVSAFIATPWWQTGPGVPGKQGRYTPDISFTAAAHDPYASCQASLGGNCVPDGSGAFMFQTVFGTSASASSMAGVAALLNQQMQAPQGHLNPKLYAAATSGMAGMFNDITESSSAVASCDVTVPSMCNNSTAGPNGSGGGLAGYLLTPGYDLATGLGSLDVGRLLQGWSSVSASEATFANYQG
ncbi:MAG TPA: S53 family peptidase, partial [Gemmatimonadaceae bacterium]|nr:S53 family peptidase [Gemmatimonadaceae bacterium]